MFDFGNFTLIKNKEILIRWEEYFYSAICCMGAFTSLLNITIFLNPKLKDPIYKFYLTSSVIDLMYTVILANALFLSCGTVCDDLRGTNYSNKFYWLFFDDYLTSCFAINNIIIELFVSIQRIIVLSNQNCFRNLKPTIVLPIIACIALIYYSPVLFLKEIVTNESLFRNSTGFSLENTKFGNTTVGRIFPVVLASIRLLIASVVLFILNLFTLVKFRKHLNKKSNLKLNVLKLKLKGNYKIIFQFFQL